MLQVARLAPSLLREASSPVAEFFLSQFNDDGAAIDRAGRSDLYYTVFALEGLIALQRDAPRALLLELGAQLALQLLGALKPGLLIAKPDDLLLTGLSHPRCLSARALFLH